MTLRPETSNSLHSVLLDTFRVRETAARIRAAEYTRIALQFPDCFLKSAPLVCSALCKLLDSATLVFVLGDTSYGACCADEVGALHLDAEAIVHYGQSCLSSTRTLPVLHVFPNQRRYINSKDKEDLRLAILNIFQNEPNVVRVLIMYDTALAEPLASFGVDTCRVDGKTVEMAQQVCRTPWDFVQPSTEEEVQPDNSEISSDITQKCGALLFSSTPPMNETAVLWIRETQDLNSDCSSPAMRNAALQLANGMSGSCHKMYYFCLGGKVEEFDAYRLFRRRAGAMSRVQQAERIGVVAGTLAVSGANEAIERCVGIIENSGKRAYVILVGKVSPPKLLNFEEIDAFVFVSCPYRALFTSKDIHVPVVTPFELESALCRSSGLYEVPYKVDFTRCTTAAQNKMGEASAGRTVSIRSKWEMSVADASSAATFHKSRKWKGLTDRLGGSNDDLPLSSLSTEVQEGSSGLALRYV